VTTQPGTVLWVFGQSPSGIRLGLLITDADSATGYIYTYSLGENRPFARIMQQQFITEAVSAPPKFIVYQADSVAFDRENEERLARWMESFIGSHYALAAMIVMEDGRAVILQGPRMDQASGPASMYIFQRTG